CLQRHYYPFTF
nr:immunoglobulin light chain junction region [Macaca mulatta]